MITSTDVRNAQFARPAAGAGYDPAAVDALLDQVTTTLAEYEARPVPVKRTDTTTLPVQAPATSGQVASLLQLAQQTADQYTADTRSAADRYYVEQRAAAEQEAQRIIGEAQAAAESEYKAQLRIHLQNHLDQLTPGQTS